MWVMRVYIVWVKTWWSTNDKIAKRMFCAYFTGMPYLRIVCENSNCHDSSHSNYVLYTLLLCGIASHEHLVKST